MRSAKEITNSLAVFRGDLNHSQSSENCLSRDERMAPCDWSDKESSKADAEDFLEKKCI